MSPELKELIPIYSAIGVLLIFVMASKRLEKRLSPMPSDISAATFASWISWFSLGFAMLITKIPTLQPFGLILIYLGIMPFLSHRLMSELIFHYVFALGVCLLLLFQATQKDTPLLETTTKPTNAYAYGLVILWGVGVTFACRRWQAARRSEGPPPLPTNP